MSVFKLIPGVQSYDWGKTGEDSVVAQYASTSPNFKLDKEKPYAELWMGTHPSCPSKLADSGKDLGEHIASHPELLGTPITDRFGRDLPFLFKVLAIRKALSIQAHPDKQVAERLHKERPDIYKDANHKVLAREFTRILSTSDFQGLQPEMAIAITPFVGFCGFLPPKDIALYLQVVPEFASLVDTDISSSFQSLVSPTSSDLPPVSPDEDLVKSGIRQVFAAVMASSPAKVKEAVSALISRYKRGEAKPVESGVRDLAITLDRQFPDDVGVLCIFLLNIVQLDAGEAVFLQANEPHAYISGDIIETMATSDNVVRAGLTPKLRDVPTLLSMLTYKSQPASEQLMVPQTFRKARCTKLYDPPIDEFSVLLTVLTPDDHLRETHDAIAGPSIFIITAGRGIIIWFEGSHRLQTPLQKGEAFFVGAGTEVTFVTEEEFVVYRAFVEVTGTP